MVVKDLVQLYESSSARKVSQRHRPDLDNSKGQELDELPPPRPARFIRRPVKLKAQDASLSRTPSSTSGSATLAMSSRSQLGSTGSLQSASTSCTLGSDFHTKSRSELQRREDHVEVASESLRQHTYPPTSFEGSSGMGIALTSSASSHYPRHRFHHRPIPATVLFARNAYSLGLPRLDHYLSSLTPPPFAVKRDDVAGIMFPPLDKLEKTKMTLDDLENNARILPVWRDRSSVLWTIASFLIDLLGSSALASFYSLQGLISTLQIFALILSTIAPSGNTDVKTSWRKLLLGIIPNVLALNFAPVLVQSLVFLTVFIVFYFFLLYLFYRSFKKCSRYKSIEGLQQTETKGRQWGLIFVTFLLTVIYLPLSTMAVHVLVWSEELWAIQNPYKNATSFPPTLPPLGPSNEFRDPLDFCWTTTMKRNEVNLAPVFIILSASVVVFFTVWFPLALDRVIRLSVPKVDRYNDIGRPRTSVDKDSEYHRMIARDHNPFSFLYQNFRRGRPTYISNIIMAKLSALLIIAVIDSDNCLFQSFDRKRVSVARQSLLVVFSFCFLIFHTHAAPFADPVDNAGEWTSRVNYVLTSLTALVIALDITGKVIFETYVLYGIYIITYGLSFYFVLINTGWMQRIVKILSRRIDFSIDIFSPRLDISPSSIHTKRRIWQESISAVLLTDQGCHIPAKQAMVFVEARESEYPPYLLDFMGTPGERYVENLKIIRDVGSSTYTRAVALTTGPDSAWYRHLEDEIQKNYTGPDSYWKNPGEEAIPGCSNYFGNAWWIPFPPTLVIRYDDERYAVLIEMNDLATYIDQNCRPDIQRKRYVRMALRTLEGQIVCWPYEHLEHVGGHIPWCCGKRYEAITSRAYHRAVLHIKRRGHLEWRGLQLGSGFEVELRYSKNVKVTGEAIGLDDDFDLNPLLARFLELNRNLIDQGLYEVQEKLSHYRWNRRKEYLWKSAVLTYRFMTFVYDHPVVPDECIRNSLQIEVDSRFRECIENNRAAFRSAYDRFKFVSRSEAATWWYIFWDDLWRRNCDTISGLRKHAADFNPHYKTSIAYSPLPRPALESFLMQRGLLHKKPQFSDFFHAGFLNKLYIRLNGAVFRKSKSAIIFHLGNDKRELDMEDVDILTQAGSSALGTGGGTDHDDPWIRARPTYRWEGLLNDPPRKGGAEPRRSFLAKLGVWFGVTPFWRAGSPSNGLSVDLKLENGQYVLLDHGDVDSSRTPSTMQTDSRTYNRG